MWYPATVTTPAGAEPVALPEAKRQCRVTFDDENEHIEDLIKAARDHVEKYCGVRFATQTVTMACDRWRDLSHLPEGPVQSIISISYVDPAGTEQVLDAGFYELWAGGLDARVVLKRGRAWPAIQPGTRITVAAVVGTEKTPPAVKHAMLSWIEEAYYSRGTAVAENTAFFDALLSNYRRFAS